MYIFCTYICDNVLRGEVWAHTMISLAPSLFTEMPVPSQKCERVYMCVRGIDCASHQRFFLLFFFEWIL